MKINYRRNIELLGKIGLILFVSLSLESCKKDSPDNNNPAPTGQVPVLTTTPISIITSTTATTGGIITSDGGSMIIQRGVCYSTNSNPTINDSLTNDGSGIGTYISQIVDLQTDTTYYVRAYATNAFGTGYGNQIIFTTICSSTSIYLNSNLNYGLVTDIDGNCYATVIIGTQEWMAENLRTTRYKNGEQILTGLTNSQWSTTTLGVYCNYDNNPNLDNTFGKLYNWYAVTDVRGLCPTGWHSPTDGEWNILVKSLDPNADTTIMFNQSLVAGGMLKATQLWLSPNIGATNSSGFTGLPSGVKSFPGGTFSFINKGMYLWSSTSDSNPNPNNGWFRLVQNDGSDIDRNSTDRRNALCVRCVKN